ncbi:MAG: hypothetical protein ACRDCZ_06270, partial [Culicoidibacterales bacterium]
HGNGKKIDYFLENPQRIEKLETYEVPSVEDLIDQQIMQLVCETCKFHNHCSSVMCIANQADVQKRFELLKSLEPEKFTPYVVILAYELEYTGIINMQVHPSEPEYELLTRIHEIVQANPPLYRGNLFEAIHKMINPETPRVYVNHHTK